MANWLTRAVGWLQGRPTGLRRFDAAKQSRLTSGWTTANPALNAELRMDLDALRARARDLSHNNDYARKFLFMAVTNIVGSNGFSFSSLAVKPDGKGGEIADTADRAAIESALAEWSLPGECDVTGRLSFPDLCRLLVRSLARDGEVLVRRVRSRSFAHGYRLQMIDIDRLDTKYNETLKSGNRVCMSVELDSYGRPVAYWLLTQHPGDTQPGQSAQRERERVPADDIFHLFVPERPEQVRGLPWMHTAMLRLNMLAGYEEAAIVAARTGAAKMGFFVSPDGTGKDIADSQDEHGQFYTDAEAGAFGVLPEGYDFKPWSPEYPTQNYDSFVKTCLRGLASGLNVAYNDLANDLEGVNFSSIRSGTLAERDQWMVLQGWLIGAFLRPVFLDWLQSALLKGAITTPNGFSLPASKLAKFKAHGWQGRRWSWVDPLKDIEASVMAIDNGLASPYTIAAQQGLDIDDILDDLARFQAAVDAKKLKLGKDSQTPPPPAPAEPTDAQKSHELLVMAMARSLIEQRQPTEPAQIHNHIAAPPAPSVTVENRIEQPAPLVIPAAEVTVENRIDATPVQVNFAAPDVNVAVEAIMPAAEAPDVIVEMPDTLKIAVTELPTRHTSTHIERDAAGDIVKSLQVEQDA